ncbi:hypothetical protein ACFYWS_39450 [Streptomyces sp. NPDC002795]|uniref:hypothetical protein n=1 Tax=Streptomyces sp. NPDC002795 TaxID=3364665 RepID=UPI0036C58D3C
MTDPTPADRIRALALNEAADFLRDSHFRDGMTVQEIGVALHYTADAADPRVGTLAREGFGLDEIAAMLAEPAAPAPADLPGRLRAVLTERFTSLGNPFSRMSYSEKGPDGWPATHPVSPAMVADVLRELLAADEVQKAEPDNPRAVCTCGHTRGEHVDVSGRLLCDVCDPDSSDNLVCKEFEEL